MSSGRVFRFAPTPDRPARHLFVFLHGCGATAQSMIPIAFRFQARLPSAALVVPSGFDPDARGGAAQDWYPTRGLNVDNHRERVASVLPDVDDLVRREQTNFGVTASRTVLIGFSQGGTVALELVKTPGLAGAVVAFSSRYARLPACGARIPSGTASTARSSRAFTPSGRRECSPGCTFPSRSTSSKTSATRFRTGRSAWAPCGCCRASTKAVAPPCIEGGHRSRRLRVARSVSDENDALLQCR